MNNYEADELHETYEAVGQTANPRILKAINRHVTHGTQSDSFTRALLCNSFVDVMFRADPENRANLYAYASYLHWCVPGNCWGSAEKVEAWREKKAAEVEA